MKKLPIRDVCILAVFAAMMLIIKEAMAALPNVEGVSLLIVLVTVFYGWKAFFPVAVFVLIEGFLYGFSFWFPFYCIVWPLLVLLVLLLRRPLGTRAWAWAIVLGLYGFLFGFVYALTLFPVGGISLVTSAYVSGLPFDVTHAVGNFLLGLLLFLPLYRLMERLTRHGKTHIMNG